MAARSAENVNIFSAYVLLYSHVFFNDQHGILKETETTKKKRVFFKDGFAPTAGVRLRDYVLEQVLQEAPI